VRPLGAGEVVARVVDEMCGAERGHQVDVAGAADSADGEAANRGELDGECAHASRRPPMTSTWCPVSTSPRVRHSSAVTAARGRAAASTSYGPGRRTTLSFPGCAAAMRHTGVVHGQHKHGHMPSVVTRCSSPRDRLVGWRCPRPGRQVACPAKVALSPGRRPAMLQARRAHWRPVAARDQLRSIGRCCVRRRATGPSLQVGRFSVGQQCVSHISCGRCWAAPRTSDREDVARPLDAGEQHAAVGLNAGPAS
jgi:hypothetical protein